MRSAIPIPVQPKKGWNFDALLAEAKSLAPDDVPAFLGELERVRVEAWRCISTPGPTSTEDVLLDAHQAAERLHVSEQYLYRHKDLPFVRRIGDGRLVRFSSLGIDAYLKKGK
jgi:hypothetical protein